ncbi:MAG: phosphopantetheine-binding protein [Pseudomonadota bacterium]
MNYYPHDIERVAGTVLETDGRTVAACGVNDKETATEELILFVSNKKELEEFIPVITRVKETIARNFNLPVSRVIPTKSIPRTTSGKLQRVRLTTLYRQGFFDPVIQDLNRLLNAGLKPIPIFTMDPDERLAAVIGFICNQAQSIMGCGPLDPNQSLVFQGIDSLIGVELRNAIECCLGITVPISWFRKDNSVREFALLILEKALVPENIPVQEKQPSSPSLLEQLQDIDRMSEDQIQKMIEALNHSQ